MNWVCLGKYSAFEDCLAAAGLTDWADSEIQRCNKLAFKLFASATAAVETPGCLQAAMTLRLNFSL
jgi:hypothetical protein